MKRYRPPKSKWRRRLIAAAVLLVVVCISVWLHCNLTAVIRSVAETAMRSAAASAVNDAVYATLADRTRYEDLVTVTRDGEGNILSLTANSYEINRIARDTASYAQSRLQARGEEGIEIPLGALTGVEAWAGFGPRFSVKIIPVSTVTCRFLSGFEGAGINQTRHSVYLEVAADVSIVMPGGTDGFTLRSQVLLCESVLVGKIPEVYLESELFGGGYDLVPAA